MGFLIKMLRKDYLQCHGQAGYNSPQLLLSLLFLALSISPIPFCVPLLLINTTQFTHCCLELKDGRVPEGITRHLGFWKAEEIHSQHQSMFLVDCYQKSIIKFGFS